MLYPHFVHNLFFYIIPSPLLSSFLPTHSPPQKNRKQTNQKKKKSKEEKKNLQNKNQSKQTKDQCDKKCQSKIKSLQKQNKTKESIEFVLYWPITCGHGACPKVWSIYPLSLHWEKNLTFPLPERINYKWYPGYRGVPVSTCLSVCWNSVWIEPL